MKKILKIIPLIITALFGINAFLFTPAYADDICDNEQVPADVRAASGCDEDVDVNEFPKAVQNIVSAIIVVIGIVAVIFIVVGGIQYITSSGDAAKTKKAKDTILYACIGLVIAALAFAIVNFVIADILKQKIK